MSSAQLERYDSCSADSAHRTAVELPSAKEKASADVPENAGATAAAGAADQLVGAEHKLSKGHKWLLLLCFSVAQFTDICTYAGAFLLIPTVAQDLHIAYGSTTWIATAYTVTFAALLPAWGRVSDLYSARPVFIIGFFGVGVFNLILSFMTNQYGYYVMRALTGVFAAATIPAAYRLIPAIFDPEELTSALTLFGLVGVMGQLLGSLLAGFFGFIKVHDQNSSWRWFFRCLGIVVLPFAALTLKLIPHTRGARSNEVQSTGQKLKRLDLPGAFFMFVGLVLLIVGLTLGSTYGFKTARFLAPFLISWVFIFGSFVWETKMPAKIALIPPSFWRIPTMMLLAWLALGIYAGIAFAVVGLLERWQDVNHQSPIIAAVRLLPSVVAGLPLAPLFQKLCEKKPHLTRFVIPGAFLLGGAGYVLLVFSEGKVGNYYWRFEFPALIIGIAPLVVAFIAVNVALLSSVPPSVSGVSGAVLQVCLQAGAVIGISIQAGLLETRPGNIREFYNLQVSYWFVAGWCLVNAIICLVFWSNKLAPGSPSAIAAESKKVHDEESGKCKEGETGRVAADEAELDRAPTTRSGHEGLHETRALDDGAAPISHI